MKVAAQKLYSRSDGEEIKVKPEENDLISVSGKVKQSEEIVKVTDKLPCISLFFSSQGQNEDLLVGKKRRMSELPVLSSLQLKGLMEDELGTNFKG